MNDRLKFRVWSNKYNDYLSPEIITTIMGLCKSNDLTTVRIGTLPSFDNNLTIEQCTGLKDKNGNLIYEGDILKYGEHTGHIFWKEDTGAWAITAFLFHRKPSELEIVGNIHEQKDAA